MLLTLLIDCNTTFPFFMNSQSRVTTLFSKYPPVAHHSHFPFTILILPLVLCFSIFLKQKTKRMNPGKGQDRIETKKVLHSSKHIFDSSQENRLYSSVFTRHGNEMNQLHFAL